MGEDCDFIIYRLFNSIPSLFDSKSCYNSGHPGCHLYWSLHTVSFRSVQEQSGLRRRGSTVALLVAYIPTYLQMRLLCESHLSLECCRVSKGAGLWLAWLC